MDNFEALGRYVAATEEAQKVAKERDAHFKDFARYVAHLDGSGAGGGGVYAAEIDREKLQGLVDKALEIDDRLRAIIDEANKYAEACGKPTIRQHKVTYY